MKNVNAMMQVISCGNVDNVLDEDQTACQREKNEKYELTEEEKEFRKKYKEKQDKLTELEEIFKNAKEKRLPKYELLKEYGPNAVNDAKRDLYSFEQTHRETIREI